MSKYSVEFKLEVVKYCLEQNHSCENAANQFNIPSAENIRRWCKRYKLHGIEGISKAKNKPYSMQYKQKVLEYMYKNHLSMSEVAVFFNISNESLVSKWVKLYEEYGINGFSMERRGRKRVSMNKPIKKIKSNKSCSKDEYSALKEENELLKMEIEYLKKLNALVQERIKRENKKK